MEGPLKLPPEEAMDRLRQAVESSDVVRASHLRVARALESAKEHRLGVELGRLEMKHGAQSPVVETVRARAAALEGLPDLLGAEIERAGVDQPEPDRTAVLAHGRVVDPSGRGIRGATVVALDASGEEVARRRTGDGGRFELRIKAPEAEGDGGAERELRLVVVEDDEEVSRGSMDLPTEAGSVVYREVAVQPAAEGTEPRKPPRPRRR